MNEDDPQPRTFQATMSLRWVVKYPMLDFANISGARVLQQAWQCRETSEVRWEDIPVAEVDEP